MVWVIIAVSVFLSVYPSPSQHEMHSVRVSNTKAVSPCRWWQLCCMWFWVSLQYRYLSTAQTNPFRPTTSHCATDSRSVRFNVQIFSRSVLAVEPCTDFTQWRRHTAALQKPSLSGADIQRPCGRLHSVAQTHSSPAQNFTQWRRHTAALHKTSLSGAYTQRPCTKLHSVAQTQSSPAQNFTQWRRHRAALHKTSLSGADTHRPCTDATQWRKHTTLCEYRNETDGKGRCADHSAPRGRDLGTVTCRDLPNTNGVTNPEPRDQETVTIFIFRCEFTLGC